MKKETFIIALLISNATCAWFWYINKKEAELQRQAAMRFEQIAKANAAEAQRQQELAMQMLAVAEANAQLARQSEEKLAARH